MTAPGYVPPVAVGWWPKSSRLLKPYGIDSLERFGNLVPNFIIAPKSILSAEGFGVITTLIPDGGNAAGAGSGNIDGGSASTSGGGSIDGGTA